MDTPPVIDGRLDEAAWQQAEPLGDFLQRLPNEGSPGSEPTEVRILFDEQALYVGVWLLDSNPAAIVEGPAIRDSGLDDSDAVLLVFDTFRDRQKRLRLRDKPVGDRVRRTGHRRGAGGRWHGNGRSGPGGAQAEAST